MFASPQDLLRIAPELILSATGILIMVLDPFLGGSQQQNLSPRRRVADVLAVLGSALALASTALLAVHRGTAFSGILTADALSVFLDGIVCAVALLVCLGSPAYLDRERLPHGEYLALVLFATAGMGVMASTQELVTGFIALEVSSIASYILAGYRRDNEHSSEAAMKYFLLGSFATAFFLYGIALVYGATGTTLLPNMDAAVSNGSLLALGFALIFVGLGFKVAAAPFQLWTPDVYEGAPAPVTAMLSSAPKAAAFALLLRILASVAHASHLWFWALWVAAVLSMFAGNLAAVVQTSVKRMLAYSSIAHAGYILVAFAARNRVGIAAVLFYLAAYALMKAGAFTMVAWLAGNGERHLSVNDYDGLASARPVSAACFSLFLLSLLGLPVTAGFLAKFYVFDAALGSHLIWLAVIVAINTIIGAYYYLRVIVAMYMRQPRREFSREQIPVGVAAVMAICAIGLVYLGLFPNAIMKVAVEAATSFPH